MDKYGFSSIKRLQYISDVIQMILAFSKNKTEAEFLSDDVINSSVLYQFIIIGEAYQSI